MNNKGFTLLEMVITVAIIGILISGVAIIFPRWLNQYTLLKQTAEAMEVMDVVASGIQDELSMSRERTWSAEGLGYVNGDRIGRLPLEKEKCTVIYTGGPLVISGQPKIYGAIFDTEFYKDMTVRLTLQEQKRSRDGIVFLEAVIEVYSTEGVLLCSETKNTFYYNPQP